MTAWRFQLFGGLRAYCGERSFDHFQTRKAALLLAKLALNLDRPCSRDELIATLWPDEYLDAARERFRQTLSSLRKALSIGNEAPPLQTDRLNVRLDSDRVGCDAADFDRLLKAARREEAAAKKIPFLEQAIERYEGPLLMGYSEEWIVAERTAYEGALVDALSRLARAYAEVGDVNRAILQAGRAVEADPIREESRHVLIGLLGRAGRSSEAARQFKEYEALILKELGSRPSRALSQLVAEVQAGSLEQDHAAQVPPVSFAPAAPSPPAPAAKPPPAEPLPVLEAPLTRFFGREEELAQLEEWFVDAPVGEFPRLVSLTGPGGCGKTRLALQFARLQIATGNRRILFVSLVDVTGAFAVPEAIREALGYKAGSDSDAMAAVVSRLSGEPTILALDNFEQLVEEGAAVVERLLQLVPALRILITSRQRLGIGAEQEMPVPPLPTPHHPGSPEEIARFPSVRLFVDRVKKVRSGFELNDENVHAVIALCDFLEGIPLAIELAAARAGVLSPRQLLDQLEDRFDFLVSRQKDLPERHRTLRAAIEWSYLSLDPAVQAFFRRLTVFRGSWTLEAARRVTGDAAALDRLEELRDKSLVVPEAAGSDVHFRLLETLRAYGDEMLSAAERREADRAHVRHYAEIASAFGEAKFEEGYSQAVPRLQAELDNIRRALEIALDPEDPLPEDALNIVSKLGQFWEASGIQREGRSFALRALALPGPATHLRRHAMSVVSDLSLGLGEPGAGLDWARRALEMAVDLGDEQGIISAVGAALAAENRNGNFNEAQDLERKLAERYDKIDDPILRCLTATNIGNSAFLKGRLADAQKWYAVGLEDAKAGTSERELAFAYTNVGEVHFREGRFREAMDFYELGFAVMRRARLRLGIVDGLRQLAQTALELDPSEKRADEAAKVLSFQERHRDEMGYPIEPEFREAYEDSLVALRRRLGEAAFQEAWRQGRSLSLESAVETAIRW